MNARVLSPSLRCTRMETHGAMHIMKCEDRNLYAGVGLDVCLGQGMLKRFCSHELRLPVYRNDSAIVTPAYLRMVPIKDGIQHEG